jgi:amidase
VQLAIDEVDMGIGTDTGGSIRQPASWCGVVGMKPTFGLVPCTGKIPSNPTVDHIGPMARTVYDCALLLEAIAGYDGGLDGQQSPTLQVPKYTEQLTGEVSGLRVGLLKEGFDGCEPDVAETVRNAAESLKQLGVTVDEFSSTLQDEISTVVTLIVMEDAYESYQNGGMSPLNNQGFKHTATHDFWFNAKRSAADTIPTTLKMAILMTSYIRVTSGLSDI